MISKKKPSSENSSHACSYRMFEIIAVLLKTHRMKVTFLIIGIWNTVVGYAVFLGLDIFFVRVFSTRFLAYSTAMILANIIAITNAFFFHKYVTFRSKTRGIAIILEFLKFCSTYMITFFLNMIALPFFVEICLIPPKIAGALTIMLCALISYFGHSRFSFSRNKAVDDQQAMNYAKKK